MDWPYQKGGIMENYIVRIYRREEDNPRVLVGVVEEVGVEGNKAFTNVDELLDILGPKKKRELHTQRKQVTKGMMKEGPINDRF
jgi:hypothetical protein